MQRDELLRRVIEAIEAKTRCHGKPGSAGWTSCRCPAHDDKEFSGSVKAGEKCILLKCFAGCTPDDMARAIGLTMHELFYDDGDKGSPQRTQRTQRTEGARATDGRNSGLTHSTGSGQAPAPHTNDHRTDGTDRTDGTGGLKPAPHTKEERRPLTIGELAKAKGIPEQFLRDLGCKEWKGKVLIPYHQEDGTPAPRTRIRHDVRAKGKGSSWTGNEAMGAPVPYGLERLAAARVQNAECRVQNAEGTTATPEDGGLKPAPQTAARSTRSARSADSGQARSGPAEGWLIVVEGESDSWTLWLHGYPALGLPGASTSSKLQREHLEGIARLFLCREPDLGGLTLAVAMAERLKEIGWGGELRLFACGDYKDPNAAWLAVRAGVQNAECRVQSAVQTAATTDDDKGGLKPAPHTATAEAAQTQPAAERFKAFMDGRLAEARLMTPELLETLRGELAAMKAEHAAGQNRPARSAAPACSSDPAPRAPAGAGSAEGRAQNAECGSDGNGNGRNTGAATTGAEGEEQLEIHTPRKIAERFLSYATDEGRFRTGERARAHLLYHREVHYRFNGRCYSAMNDADLRAWLTDFIYGRRWLVKRKRDQDATEIPGNPTKTILSNTMQILQGLGWVAPAFDPPCWPDGKRAERTLSLQNGLLDVDALLAWWDRVSAGKATEADLQGEGLLSAHTPDLFTLNALPYAFDFKAECPRWRQFLGEVQPDDELRELLQEWCGYCLLPTQDYRAVLILEGRGGNGKSVFMDVLEHLVGQANCSHVSLDVLHDPFMLRPMVGKLVNFAAEWGRIEPAAENLIKAISGGDGVHINPKQKEGYEVRLPTRFVISTNQPPRLNDRSRAIWDRLITVPFPVEIPISKRRPKALFVNELCEELPGILSWAMYGLWRLVRRGTFARPKLSEALKASYREDANPALVWCDSSLLVDETVRTRVGLMYQAYREFCRDGGFTPLNEIHFGATVREWYREKTQGELAKERRMHDETHRRVMWYVGVALEAGGGEMVKPPEATTGILMGGKT